MAACSSGGNGHPADAGVDAEPDRPGSGGPCAASAIFAGGAHACALTAGKGLWCWGANDWGQLGIGDQLDQPDPVPVSGIDGEITSVALGGRHSCVTKADRSLWCWGGNDKGQAYRPSSVNDMPGPVALSGVLQVVAGDTHTCARDVMGYVYCWGQNNLGQVGNGIDEGKDNLYVPNEVAGIHGEVKSLVAGTVSTCALLADGAAICWGAGKGKPTAIAGDGLQVVGAALGRRHMCLLGADGVVTCVGDNERGQAGQDVRMPLVKDLVPVPFLAPGTASLTAGDAFTCALGADGHATCWGDNWTMALGAGPGPGGGVGVAPAFERPAGLAAGPDFVCARAEDGLFGCWGANGGGQIGDGRLLQPYPMVVWTGAAAVSGLAAGPGDTCAALADGNVTCWGRNEGGQAGVAPSYVVGPTPVAGGGYRSVALGLRHACGVRSDGSVWCWGAGDRGQLGGMVSDPPGMPVKVEGLSGPAKSVFATDLGSCAVLDSGELWCWGLDFQGYPIGPAPKLLLADVDGMAVGNGYLCRLSHGAIRCVGDNGHGQFGDGTITTMAGDTMLPASDAVAVVAGSTHTCALRAGGALLCWGGNRRGQLGIGDTADSRWPRPILEGVASVAARADTTCALLTDGTLDCWGDGQYGQLGDGLRGFSTRPVPVTAAGTGLGALALGPRHVCVASGAAVTCWGYVGAGALGDPAGAVRAVATPAAVCH